MKKLLAMVLAVLMIASFAACGKDDAGNNDVDIFAKSEGVMTYAEYEAAALETPVTIEAFIQAKQSWWDNKGTFYTQDKDGAYFLYELPCTQEEYDKLAIGTKVKVSGTKTAWAGEVEIIDATWEILEGTYVAEAIDVTDILASDELIKKQNMFVKFTGMTVVAKKDAEGNDVAFLYNWDGSGAPGNDLYFDVAIGEDTYTFTVESYLTGDGTEVYEAVEALQIGDVINMEGFLYWYEGVNPHITKVTK